jgi:hypothetical protein
LRNPDPDDGSAAYEVNLPVTAGYVPWVRARGGGTTADSMWIQIDGMEPAVLTFEVVAPPAYTWSRLTDNDGAPAVLPLTAGNHTVQIFIRELDLSFDTFILVADATFVPTGMGPGPDTNAPPRARIATIPDMTTLYLFDAACDLVLDGGESWDDGVPEPLHFSWDQRDGPAAVTWEPAGADTEQVRVTMTETGSYTFRLTVSDGSRQDSEDIVISVAEPGPLLFRRGDASDDGVVNIGDAISVLASLFGDEDLVCPDAGDANDDGRLNIADPITLLDYLFGTGDPLPAPGATWCNEDPTPDNLGPCEGESCS